jgi:molecular chaperone DnaK
LKADLESKVTAVRDALKSDNLDAIKSASTDLEKTMTELYNAAQQMGGAGSAPDVEPGGDDQPDEPRKAKGKVVDAEVVD